MIVTRSFPRTHPRPSDRRLRDTPPGPAGPQHGWSLPCRRGPLRARSTAPWPRRRGQPTRGICPSARRAREGSGRAALLGANGTMEDPHSPPAFYNPLTQGGGSRRTPAKHGLVQVCLPASTAGRGAGQWTPCRLALEEDSGRLACYDSGSSPATAVAPFWDIPLAAVREIRSPSPCSEPVHRHLLVLSVTSASDTTATTIEIPIDAGSQARLPAVRCPLPPALATPCRAVRHGVSPSCRSLPLGSGGTGRVVCSPGPCDAPRSRRQDSCAARDSGGCLQLCGGSGRRPAVRKRRPRLAGRDGGVAAPLCEPGW